ncbi:uncharacterized protein F4807DRAFT_465277 [Annulohypoxylon truncatum]|nr:uncharacterized protein F4807DRAFT_465277 [Annulohypoxylon truncatum]KAI1204776.1 hypothetical protein F4807DRAFT_465277 [Annulohypoxylon truncatum]
MDPNNPLSEREKALENQYIREKEKQLAKAKAAKKIEQEQQSDQGMHQSK